MAEEHLNRSTHPGGKKILAWIIAAGALLAAVLGLRFWQADQARNISSEEAALQANVVHISTAIPGQIAELLVQEGARVKRGEVLFRLEPELYALRLEQTQAELAIAEAALHTRGRVVKAESANAVMAKEQISRAQTNLALTQRTVERLRPLVAQGYATQQELDIAVTAQRDAQVSLSQAGSQLTAAQQLVGHVDAAEAAVSVARVNVAMAQKALDDTVVRAPHDGLIVGLRVSSSERLLPGQSLFTLVDSRNWYAQALYLETELQHIAEGACAKVRVLAQPQRILSGKVVGIGWGVNSEQVLNLPMSLPYVQKSLNWVRVAQRFPVRVLLQDAPPELMRMGASATVTIQADQVCP